MKTCVTCSQTKPLSEFGIERRNKDGYRGQCKMCVSAYQDNWRKNNKDLKKEYGQKWYYKAKHKITYEDFLERGKLQNDKCAICSTELKYDSIGNNKAVQDHDHATGKLRDILCHSCNLGLGKFMDNPNILESALNYLRKHNE